MKSNRGFTLIEVIITITLIAIAAALFVAYIGTAFTKSPVSSGMVAKQYALIQEMEIITSKYRQEIENGTLDLNNFLANPVNVNPFVDAANTGFRQLTGDGGYVTGQVLMVTLRDGDQSVMSIFSQ
ncbi:MAG TPA: prepilin-type N-terminal cleavage/methylation domain-containing protein [Deltaproteobacteria bacterium]|nr:prepilin-type N-terminal cleavage/methylation domain-containing protein [Deltaproteobacteria bacterium]